MINIAKHSKEVFARLEEVGYDALDEKDKVFVCVWESTTAISKDGFERFYAGGCGDRAVDTPAAYEKIGAVRSGELIKQANALFGAAGPSRDEDERFQQVRRFGEEETNVLYALREKFNAKPDNILFLLMEYLETC